jgi:hypothetical protein
VLVLSPPPEPTLALSARIRTIVELLFAPEEIGWSGREQREGRRATGGAMLRGFQQEATTDGERRKTM